MGNQMLQLMYGLKLQTQVDGLSLHGYEMPIWGLTSSKAPALPLIIPTARLRGTDGVGLPELFAEGLLPRARLRDVPLRHAYFQPAAQLQSIFPLLQDQPPLTGPDEILISVRGAEILKAIHPDYGPIPVQWYRDLIAETGLSPVFMGQLSEDFYSELLRRSFPDARFVPSRGILQDFTALRQAEHLVLSVSTFSWLAGWLSLAAKSIHMPLLGIYNPRQREDIWLLPQEDSRFRFYDFPLRKWSVSDDQVADLEASRSFPALAPEQVRDLHDWIESRRQGIRRASLAKLRKVARVAWLPNRLLAS